MKRYSVYLLFSVLVIASYVILDVQLGYRLWKEEYQSEFALKVDRLRDEAFLAKAYLKSTDSFEQLHELLNSRMNGRNVDFWILYYKDRMHKTNLEDWQLRALKIQNSDLAKTDVVLMLDGVHHSFLATDLGGGFTLVIGKTYDLDRYLKFQLDRRVGSVLKDMILACLASILIFAYFFRDIVKSIRLLSGGNKRNFKGLSVHSKEAELIVRGFSAYEDHATKLAMEKDILSWQVLPALRTELMSGKAPPYEFTCTLVRTDINHFSRIYNEYPVAPFTSTINDFFTDVTHVVSRYGGLIHEFVGDEVIYYFKDDDVGRSEAVALAAIRDIHAVAAHYHRLTMSERSYAFTVKSSFAKGSIQFRRFVNGFNLAGPVLIETVRILSHVNEKSENTLVFNARHEGSIRDLAQTEPYARVQLKGYSGEQDLVTYLEHRPLASVLQAVNETNVDALSYYRSDDDIVQILQWLSMATLKRRYEVVQKVLSVLRGFHLTRVDLAVPITLAEWLENLLTRLPRIDSIDQESHLQVLSAAIRLIENLIPVSQFDERLEAICRQAASSANRRVIANALDVMTVMKSGREPEFSRKLLEHEDNRVVANALVYEGSRAITPLILKRIRKMLSMKEEKFVASALYALGEIGASHRARDPIYFQAQTDLLTIVAALPVYVKSPSEMIRKQSLIAAKKIADERILSQIWEIAEKSESPERRNEIREHLASPDATILHLKKVG